jgi:hypothetical protein
VVNDGKVHRLPLSHISASVGRGHLRVNAAVRAAEFETGEQLTRTVPSGLTSLDAH